MRQYLLSFRREANHNLRCPTRGQHRENVGGGFKLEHELRFALFLELLPSRHFWAKVCDRGSHDQNRRGREMPTQRVAHLARCVDRNSSYAWRRRQSGRPCNQNNLRPSIPCSFCNCISHLSGRTVGNKTNRINGFLSRSRGDQHPLSLPITLRDQRLMYCIQDF